MNQYSANEIVSAIIKRDNVLLDLIIADVQDNLDNYKEILNRYEAYVGDFITDNIYSLLMKNYYCDYIKKLLPVFDFHQKNNYDCNTFESSLINTQHIDTSDVFIEYINNKKIVYKDWNIVPTSNSRGYNLDIPLIEYNVMNCRHPYCGKILLMSEHPFTSDSLRESINILIRSNDMGAEINGFYRYVKLLKSSCYSVDIKDFKNDLVRLLVTNNEDFTDLTLFEYTNGKCNLKLSVFNRMFSQLEKLSIDSSDMIKGYDKVRVKI